MLPTGALGVGEPGNQVQVPAEPSLASRSSRSRRSEQGKGPVAALDGPVDGVVLFQDKGQDGRYISVLPAEKAAAIAIPAPTA